MPTPVARAPESARGRNALPREGLATPSRREERAQDTAHQQGLQFHVPSRDTESECSDRNIRFDRFVQSSSGDQSAGKREGARGPRLRVVNGKG